MSTGTEPFYVAGGTLQRDAPSYVPRCADSQLHAALAAGAFCYVLTSRQMGKSSLMVRTAARLRQDGTTVALVDLTAIGQNLTAEQWYNGLLGAIGEQVRAEDALADAWRAHAHLGPLHRWQTAVRGLVAGGSVHRLAIFIDEIDVVRNLPFSADEFFAGIRELYNRRSEEPDLQRLTFCLLGSASPADLIRDSRTTPFNIGTRVELHDFTAGEATPLLRGFDRAAPVARALLDRVLHWTGGHPYLTQRLCLAVAGDPSASDARDVDRWCADLFLGLRARERDDNLLFVRENIAASGAALSDVLDLVDRVRDTTRVREDEQGPAMDHLRLSGITRLENGRLRIRNRIYARVFDAAWVRLTLPGADRRRQRAAYRRGLARASLAAAVVILALGTLAWFAMAQRNRARAQEAVTGRVLYAAEMNLAQQAWRQGDAARVLELLAKNVPKPGAPDPRGFEWHQLWRATHAYRRVYAGHTAAVTALDLSPDGRRLATAGWDGTARVWDASSGQSLFAIPVPDAPNLYAIAFTPDGKRLITADMTTRVWDAVTGAALGTLPGHTGRVNAVAVSPDGRLVATAGSDRTVRLLDLSTMRLVRVLTGHTGPVRSVAFVPGGRQLVSASMDGSARIWSTEDAAGVVLTSQPEHGLQAVAVSPDGSRIAVGGWPDAVTVWDTRTHRVTASLRGHNALVTAMGFSPDGQLLVTGGLDGTARVWDIAGGTQRALITVNDGRPVTAVRFSGDSTFFTAGNNNAAELWDVDVAQQAQVVVAHDDAVSSLAFSPDGHTLATGSWDGSAKFWRSDTAAEIVRVRHQGGRVHSIAFSPDGQFMTTSGSGPGMEVWDARTGGAVATITDGWTPMFFPRTTEMIVMVEAGTKLWQTGPWKALRREHREREWVLTAISPDGKRLIFGRNDGQMLFVDATTFRVVHTMRTHEDAIADVQFSPDGAVMATAGLDGQIKLWRDYVEVGALRGHKGWVNAVAFSPDGRRLASASFDETVKIWDVPNRMELVTLTGHRGSVMAIAFSPDGHTLVSGGADRTFRIWRSAR